MNDEFFSQFSGCRIAYCANPGNAGDSLIAAATLQRFARHRIEIDWVQPRDVVEPGRIVIYAGGGNWVPEYRDCSTFVRANHRQAERFILLPHTVAGNEELLAELGPNVDLCLREPVSYEHCLRHAPGARPHLAEDMALQLDVAALLAMPIPSPLTFRLQTLRKKRRRKVRREFLRLWRNRLFFRSRLNELVALREDCESLGAEPPPGNLDLSELLMYRTFPPEAVWHSARHLIDFIRPYRSIRTDRLHVAIAGCLLGKEVEFHPNSYFKNEAIYRHSLEPRFPRIHWMGP